MLTYILLDVRDWIVDLTGVIRSFQSTHLCAMARRDAFPERRSGGGRRKPRATNKSVLVLDVVG